MLASRHGRSERRTKLTANAILLDCRMSASLFPIPYSLPCSLFPASRNDCRISVAATWSTTGGALAARGRLHRESGAPRAWSAARPTGGWEGRSARPARRQMPGSWRLAGSARRRDAPGCQPRCPPPQTGAQAAPASAGRLARLRWRSSVSTGCAVRPSSSDTATPMRRLPTSRPR